MWLIITQLNNIYITFRGYHVCFTRRRSPVRSRAGIWFYFSGVNTILLNLCYFYSYIKYYYNDIIVKMRHFVRQFEWIRHNLYFDTGTRKISLIISTRHWPCQKSSIFNRKYLQKVFSVKAPNNDHSVRPDADQTHHRPLVNERGVNCNGIASLRGNGHCNHGCSSFWMCFVIQLSSNTPH